MTKQTTHEKWMAAISQLKELTRLAGIDVAIAALGEPSKFTAEWHEKARREIIFAIPDVVLRRRIIRTECDCHRLFREHEQEELQKLRFRIADNGERQRRNALWIAVTSGIGAILLGYYYWHLLGAIVAAVPSLLIGFDSIRRADRAAIADIEATRRELRTQEQFLSELGTDDSYSKTEEATGCPDI